MKWNKGDKVVVKGLDMAFVVECYLDVDLVKLFIEGERVLEPPTTSSTLGQTCCCRITRRQQFPRDGSKSSNSIMECLTKDRLLLQQQ